MILSYSCDLSIAGNIPDVKRLLVWHTERHISATVLIDSQWHGAIALACVMLQPQNVDIEILQALQYSSIYAPAFEHDRIAINYLEYCMKNEGGPQ